ncbi:MAG: hypothetical protein CVU41_02120 [Chloroflexi bacterium HGW-Chloroflexi-3]|nr:MAG: hypothetical protein CVU41_02120 [Chloroflexi bacterium HGW-Chloroflexi-3]
MIGDTKFFIFTTTPEWFFQNSLSFQYEYIETQTDVGLIQTNPFIEDMDKTINALEIFFPFSDIRHAEFLRYVSKIKLDLILCDISPFGLWIAEKLGIPSILVENFTWDWIYEYYQDRYPKLNGHISLLREIYQLPKMHFTCEPYCKISKNSIIVSPVFRESRSSREEIRRQLRLSDEDLLVLVTMGGIPIDHHNGNIFLSTGNLKFLFPVNNPNAIIDNENIIFLSHNHPYFHPDLVNASDLVIGKLGYSTVVEVYSHAKPFLFIGKKNFRESSVLEKFVREEIISDEIEVNNLFSLHTLNKIQNLISTTKTKNQPINGADQIVNIIRNEYI